MGCPGFEPGTNRLKADYSTIELTTQNIIIVNIVRIAHTIYFINRLE